MMSPAQASEEFMIALRGGTAAALPLSVPVFRPWRGDEMLFCEAKRIELRNPTNIVPDR